VADYYMPGPLVQAWELKCEVVINVSDLPVHCSELSKREWNGLSSRV